MLTEASIYTRSMEGAYIHDRHRLAIWMIRETISLLCAFCRVTTRKVFVGYYLR